MPVSKVRKRHNNNFGQNILRGTIDKRQGVEIARSTLPAAAISKFANWAAAAYSQTSGLRGIYPKSPKNICNHTGYADVGLEKELEWKKGLFNRYSSQLEKYVSLRNELEQHLFNREYQKALQTVDSITNDVCWSLDMMAYKIALVRIVDGLEEQKNWITENLASSHAITARFFAYWFGVRSEKLSNASTYVVDILRRISAIAESTEDDFFLKYLLCGSEIPEPYASSLMSQFSTHSIIDQYECCVAIVTTASLREWSSSNPLYQNFLPIMKRFGDARAKKIAFLFGELDAIEGIGISKSIEIFQTADSPDAEPSNPIDPTELLYLTWTNYFIDKKEVNEDNTLASMLSNILSKQSKFERAKDDLLKRSLLFPRTRIGNWSHGILDNIPDGDTYMSDFALLKIFLSSYTVDPLIVPHLNPLLRNTAKSYILRNLHLAELKSISQTYWGDIEKSQFNKNALACAFDLLSEVTSGDIVSAEKSARILRKKHFKPTKLSIHVEINEAIKNHKVLEVMQIVSEIHDNFTDYLHWIPWDKIANVLDDRTVGQHSHELVTCLTTFLLDKLYDSSFDSAHAFSVEIYLDSIGIDKPSKMAPDFVSGDKRIVSFLYEQCTTACLSLSIRYDGPEDVDKERIAILELLASCDPENEETYEKEITKILWEDEVAKAVTSLDKSKISLDENQLKNWATRNLSNKFERYRSYIDAGLAPVENNFADDLLDAIEAKNVSEKHYEVPDNDAASLLVDIVNILSKEFSLNPKHGINTYLSLRIRHGTISGHLRKIAHENKLLTIVEESSGEYAFNNYWFDTISTDHGIAKANLACNELASFSQDFDGIITNFTDNLIQVKRNEKPKGLFNYTLPNVVILAFGDETKEIKDFEEFLDHFIPIYWQHVENLLKHIRDFIGSKLKAEFHELFRNLEVVIKNNGDGHQLSVLNAAITRTKAGLDDALSEMSSWFVIPQAIDSSPVLPEILVKIGLEMVKRLHPDFTPKLEIKDDIGIPLSNSLSLFPDIFFILIGNIQKHSGIDAPFIRVVFAPVNQRQFKICIDSQCVNPSRHLKSVDAAREKLMSGNYEASVSSEGGSGFYKIAKLMNSADLNSTFNFKINNDDDIFQAELLFNYRQLSVEDEEIDRAHITG